MLVFVCPFYWRLFGTSSLCGFMWSRWPILPLQEQIYEPRVGCLDRLAKENDNEWMKAAMLKRLTWGWNILQYHQYIYQYLTICSSIVQAHAESEILSAAEDISAILGVSNTVKHLDVPGSLLSPLPFKVFRPTTKLGVDSGGIWRDLTLVISVDPCGSMWILHHFHIPSDIPVISQWPLGAVMFSHAVFFCVNTSFSLALEGVLKGLLADERLTPLQRCFPRVGPNGTEYVPSMDTWYIFVQYSYSK
jgi:hypothetical protein